LPPSTNSGNRPTTLRVKADQLALALAREHGCTEAERRALALCRAEELTGDAAAALEAA